MMKAGPKVGRKPEQKRNAGIIHTNRAPGMLLSIPRIHAGTELSNTAPYGREGPASTHTNEVKLSSYRTH